MGHEQMDLSFAGCGFMGIYHVGVLTCLRQYVPELLKNNRIAGASAGSLAACGLICESDLGAVTTSVLTIALEVRSRHLGPLHPTFNLLARVKKLIEDFLPSDAYLRCNGRLHVALTNWTNFKLELVSQFQSNNELVEALLCSCFIPLICGMIPPSFKGQCYVDGGFSSNNPTFDDKTVTVAPFAGESDICPMDEESSQQLHASMMGTSFQVTVRNIMRIGHILYPPEAHTLSRICRNGFDDTLRYLQREKLLGCAQHLSMSSQIINFDPPKLPNPPPPAADAQGTEERVYVVLTDDEEEMHEVHTTGAPGVEHSCVDCHEKRVNIHQGLPNVVLIALQAGIDSVNNNVFSNIYNHRVYRVLALMAQPYVLPIEVTIDLSKRFLEWAPYLPRDMQWFVKQFIKLLKTFCHNMERHRHAYSARLTCQLAITEVDFDHMVNLPSPTPLLQSRTDHLHHHHHHHHHTKQPTISKRDIEGFTMEFSQADDPKQTPEQVVSTMRHRKVVEKAVAREARVHEEAQSRALDTSEESVALMEEVEDDDVSSSGDSSIHSSAHSSIHSSAHSSIHSSAHSSGHSSAHSSATAGHFIDYASYDSFDNCLQIAAEHDSLLTFHYMEENGTVVVNEIFPTHVHDMHDNKRELEWNSAACAQELGHRSGGHGAGGHRSGACESEQHVQMLDMHGLDGVGGVGGFSGTGAGLGGAGVRFGADVGPRAGDGFSSFPPKSILRNRQHNLTSPPSSTADSDIDTNVELRMKELLTPRSTPLSTPSSTPKRERKKLKKRSDDGSATHPLSSAPMSSLPSSPAQAQNTFSQASHAHTPDSALDGAR